jgi:hypothetical protein
MLNSKVVENLIFHQIKDQVNGISTICSGKKKVGNFFDTFDFYELPDFKSIFRYFITRKVELIL